MQDIEVNAQTKKWEEIIEGKVAKDEIVVDYLTNKISFAYLSKEEIGIEYKEKAVSIVIESLLNTSIDRIKTLLKYKKCFESISPSNIPQFSNFASVAIFLPELLNEKKESFSYEELGYLLFSEAKSNIAATKYGENHGKMAVLLDLAVLKRKEGLNVFEQSLLTEQYCNLGHEDRMKLLTRLCYRIPIIQNAVVSEDPNQTLEDSMQKVLARSTYMRRKSNVLEVLAFALEQ